MNPDARSVPQSSADGMRVESRTVTLAQTFYWCVRRELFEHRSIYIAPAAAAGVALFGFLLSTVHLPAQMRAAIADPARMKSLSVPFEYAAAAIMMVAMVVQLFYCLDSLQSERRDRSILFWKSLPVSDVTTVLSKASIPLVVLPVLVVVIAVVTHLVMVLISTAVLLLSGINPVTLWRQLPLFQMELVLIYGVIVLALGQAPLFAWLLLISGWGRRAAFLWAVLPPLAICAVEKFAFNTHHFAALLLYLITGGSGNAFSFRTPSGAPVDPHFIPLAQITPGRFLSSPGLWIGLAFAAVFLAAAVRLRRY